MENSLDKPYVLMRRGYFYRPRACGYTDKIEEAGRYSWEEAKEHVHDDHEPVTMHLASDFEQDVVVKHGVRADKSIWISVTKKDNGWKKHAQCDIDLPLWALEAIEESVAGEEKYKTLLKKIDKELEDIQTRAHCIAKAGPLSTSPDEVWSKFMRLEIQTSQVRALIRDQVK